MARSDREKAFGEKSKCETLWCLHCERTYDYGKWRVVRGLQMCPFLDCNGDAVLDAWDWKKVRDANPGYPEKPETGKVYPLYQ